MSSTSSITGNGALISTLTGGIDTESLINQLMQVEAIPQNALKTKLTSHQTTLTAYQDLNTALKNVRTASQDLALGYNWKAKQAASSDTSVTATASIGATNGSLTFRVNQLASAQSLASFGTVSSTSAVVGTGTLTLGQTGAIGIAQLKGTGVSTGAHTFDVTQASAGATVSGTALGNSITLSGTETLTATIGGVAKSFTLTAGTYNQTSLAAMVTSVSGGLLNVSTNSNKSLKVATTHEGSAATLQITGGTGLAALGLTAGAAVSGTNAIVKVDGVSNTVTSVKPDGSNTVTLNSSAGTFTTGFSSGLRVGTATVNTISLGDGKLSTVVDAINNSSSGITAAAVQVTPGNYKLQLQSAQTGSAGGIGVDLSAFTSTLGDFQTVSAAQDAILQVGSGASGYTINSSSNAVSNVLSGVTINLTKADSTKDITVTVSGDGSSLADKVSDMITSVNDALAYIKNNSKYDKATLVAGVFLGNSTARSLEQGLLSAVGDLVSGSSLNASSSVGIKLSADGTYTFDKTTFLAAYQKDPEAVAKMFVEGGSTSVTTNTIPGIAERLTTLAKQATDSVSGKITAVINGENSQIDRLNTQITSWDDRLAKRKTSLQAIYTAMATAISNANATETWLTNQIKGLQSDSSS